jgi:hypothetical protein
MAFSQKDFADWQNKCVEVTSALFQENQRISDCKNQIKSLHEKEKNIEEKSSTASIEGLLAVTSVCISQNTIVHIEAHARELQEQLKELKEEKQYTFFHSLENDPRAYVEELVTSLKNLVQTEQDNYTDSQTPNFRHWLSEANREIEFISRQQKESKEDEKTIYQRKLFQLAGYICASKYSKIIQLLQNYPLDPNDCSAEFKKLKETHPEEFEKSSLTEFIEKEREQFVAANQQLQEYLTTRPQQSTEYRALYDKVNQMLKQVNEQPNDYLDIKLKTKTLVSTHELLQNPQGGEDRMQKYKVLANTVRRRESNNCTSIAGTMLMIASGIALFVGLMCLTLGTVGIAPIFGIAAGLLLSGGGLFACGERQKINYNMHQIARKNLPEENHVELGPRSLLTSL